MTSKELTALEALELLKKLKKNNIDDQEVEDMLLDIIEEELKEHRLLKSIEEELGIDLILSLNICKKANSQKYVYMKDSYGISKLTFLNDMDVELFHHRLYANSWGVWMSLDLKEYGKEWALTRKELEDD